MSFCSHLEPGSVTCSCLRLEQLSQSALLTLVAEPVMMPVVPPMATDLPENQRLPQDQDPDDSVASADRQTISDPADGMNDNEKDSGDPACSLLLDVRDPDALRGCSKIVSGQGDRRGRSGHPGDQRSWVRGGGRFLIKPVQN